MSETITDCLFCRILAGDIPADIIYESDTAIAFRDINPQAPTHVLIIPRKHVATINDIDPDDQEIVGSLYSAARDIAAAEGIASLLPESGPLQLTPPARRRRLVRE